MELKSKRKLLKDILLEYNLVPEDKINSAIEESNNTRIPLQQILVNQKLIDKETLLKKLSEEWGTKYIDLTKIQIEPEIAKLIPEASAKRYRAIPFAKEENMLYIAMVNPRDLFAIEDIHLRTGFDIVPYLAMPDDIDKTFDKIYGATVAEEALSKIISSVSETEHEEIIQAEKPQEKSDIAEIDATTPEVEKMVNAIILGAIQKKASDIHIEPFENKFIIRYRIDGELQESQFVPPFSYRNAVIAKIKIMTASMDITEHRRPQDGRIQVIAGGKPIEFRVNIIPTVFGESCVMRILDRSSIMVDMMKLGFLEDTQEKIKKSIEKPYGIILVCGPTGSGKSTTLYSILNYINEPGVKILTAENPVEYNLEGIIQVPIQQEIGFDFAAALRAFLRQDPDVIMVGEIRDKETATIAMEAAMTGHLVFSTIHTNDAPSAVARLYEMGVLPFMISSSIECVLAQRLVRRVCPQCAEPIQPTDFHMEIFKNYNIDTSNLQLKKGKGCKACNNTGLKGRLGIHELLVFTDEMRALTLKEFAAGPIRELAIKQGMRTLAQDGLIKAARGLTTIEQVLETAQ